MSINKDQISEFAGLISDLYDKILLNDLPDDSSYRGYLDRDTPFALDENGYRTAYLPLVERVFHIPHISEMWSEDGVQDLAHSLVVSLASMKNDQTTPVDFEQISEDWLNKIDLEFEQFGCYSSVSGLVVNSSLKVCEVTFLPIAKSDKELEGELAKRFHKELNDYRDCIAYSEVTAEWRRASQIHREKTEYSLNVVRFMASLIWHDQPTRHVYLEGHDPKGISDTLVVSTAGEVSSVGASEFTPHPIDLRDEMMPYAEFYDFDFVRDLLDDPSPSELSKSFLTAIQWFGRATQETNPLVAFIKFYVAIEAALKKPSESAKTVLPRRIGVLINPWDRTRIDKLEDDLRDLIDERNSVFHSGVPISSSPEVLQWDSRVLSRQVLHQLRIKLKKEGWQSKDNLLLWVDHQYFNTIS